MKYSNCLFEAIKAKLKDPMHINIHVIPPRLNNSVFPHFWWDDGFRGYDFKQDKKGSILFFKGHVRDYSLHTYRSLYEDELFDIAEGKCKKYIKNYLNTHKWQSALIEIPAFVDCVELLYKKDDQCVIQIAKRADAHKYAYEYWKEMDDCVLSEYTFNGIEKNSDGLDIAN